MAHKFHMFIKRSLHPVLEHKILHLQKPLFMRYLVKNKNKKNTPKSTYWTTFFDFYCIAKKHLF